MRQRGRKQDRRLVEESFLSAPVREGMFEWKL